MPASTALSATYRMTLSSSVSFSTTVPLKRPWKRCPTRSCVLLNHCTYVPPAPLHAAGEGRLRCVDDQVIVVGHQLVFVHDPLVAFDGVAEELEKAEAVGIAQEDVLVVVAATEQVPGGA